METEDIEKKLADFESKFKPVTKGETTLHAVELPTGVAPEGEAIIYAEVGETVPVGVAEPGEPCINKPFKEMVGSLQPGYVGHQIKDFVMEFFNSIQECEVSA